MVLAYVVPSVLAVFRLFVDSDESFGPDGMPCVVLWRPQALDCRVLIPPEIRGESLHLRTVMFIAAFGDLPLPSAARKPKLVVPYSSPALTV